MFSARAFNIESLSVAPTEDPSLSRMTLVTRGSDEIVEQISKQLHKLVDVVKLQDLTEGSHIEREIMLIKLKASGEEREEIKRLTDIFRGRVLDVSSNTYTIEVTGDGDKLDAFVSAVDAQLILEVVRSGPLGIARREKSLHV